jgi:hypothetical protein
MARGFLTQRRKALARQSRNQKNFTEANEGNEEQEKSCQKCAILGNSTAKAQTVVSVLASLQCDFALKCLFDPRDPPFVVQLLWLGLAALGV